MDVMTLLALANGRGGIPMNPEDEEEQQEEEHRF